ncbi:MAG: hypothetical protein DRJ66_00580 [Thermoprotei archaeon]|nr:MAG: hypothetical protein DRJ66_00580 [Thermoprotei archaeon]RLF19448.1 MAG: hypothetical protein DRZ82_05755 [Thermoprotei archaeon]
MEIQEILILSALVISAFISTTWFNSLLIAWREQVKEEELALIAEIVKNAVLKVKYMGYYEVIISVPPGICCEINDTLLKITNGYDVVEIRLDKEVVVSYRHDVLIIRRREPYVPP